MRRGTGIVTSMGEWLSDDELDAMEARTGAHRWLKLISEVRFLRRVNDDLLEACKQALGAFEHNWAINWDDLRRAIEKAEPPTPHTAPAPGSDPPAQP